MVTQQVKEGAHTCTQTSACFLAHVACTYWCPLYTHTWTHASTHTKHTHVLTPHKSMCDTPCALTWVLTRAHPECTFGHTHKNLYLCMGTHVPHERTCVHSVMPVPFHSPHTRAWGHWGVFSDTNWCPTVPFSSVLTSPARGSVSSHRLRAQPPGTGNCKHQSPVPGGPPVLWTDPL